jgi:hypothetical protein
VLKSPLPFARPSKVNSMLTFHEIAFENRVVWITLTSSTFSEIIFPLSNVESSKLVSHKSFALSSPSKHFSFIYSIWVKFLVKAGEILKFFKVDVTKFRKGFFFNQVFYFKVTLSSSKFPWFLVIHKKILGFKSE